jgi:hypothetical protein
MFDDLTVFERLELETRWIAAWDASRVVSEKLKRTARTAATVAERRDRWQRSQMLLGTRRELRNLMEDLRAGR